MQAITTRLSLPTAAAVVAASVITITPAVGPPPVLSAIAPSAVHTLQLPDLKLAATIADILQVPALKQWVINQIQDIVVLGAGLIKAGQGLGQTIAGIPEFALTVTQQVFAGDLLGALTTVEKGLTGAVTLIGAPLLAASIQRSENALAVDLALVQAVPAAFIGLGAGFVAGFDSFARSVIIAGQNLVGSLLPINIGNVITALVDGTKLIVQGLSTGAGKILDGVVFFQQTIATALAAQPTAVAAQKPATAVSAASLPKPAAATLTLSPVATAATALATTTAPKGTKNVKPTSATATAGTASSHTDSPAPDAGKKTVNKPPKKANSHKDAAAA